MSARRKPTSEDRAKLLNILFVAHPSHGSFAASIARVFFYFDRMTDDPKLATILVESYAAQCTMFYDDEKRQWVDATHERLLRAVREARFAWNWAQYELDVSYEASRACK